MRVDLGKLNLPGPGAAAAFVDRHPISEADRREAIRTLLAAKIPQAAVDALLHRIEVEAGSRDMAADWPTAGEDREVLLAAAALANALAKVLHGASPRADAEIAAAAMAGLGNVLWPQGKAGELARFARAARARADQVEQSRRAAWRTLVVAFDSIAGKYLPAPSKSRTSTYYKACQAAFILAGHPSSPDRAIAAVLLNEEDDWRA